MGESVNFVPVIEELVQRGERVEVLLLGTAREKFVLPEQMLYPEGLVLENRFALADGGYVERLAEHIRNATVVTGVSCLFAKQLHEALGERGDVRLVSYWDNIQTVGVSDYFTVAREVAAVSKELWVPSEKTQTGFPQATVVGYPSLKQEEKVVTYIGSWDGEASYRRAWSWFCKVWAECSLEGVKLLFILHPKSGGGSWEAAEFRKVGLELNIHSSSETMHLIKTSDLILCERTSTAEKAALLGCPVIHVLPPDDGYSTVLLEAGITKRASSAEELQKAFQDIVEESYAGRAYKALGIPQKERMLMLL